MTYQPKRHLNILTAYLSTYYNVMAVGISLHGQIEPQGQYRYVLIRANIWKAGVPKFGLISKNLNLFRKQLQVNSVDQLELVTQSELGGACNKRPEY